MTKLNQIVAIEKGIRTTVERDVTDLYHSLQKAPLLSGISRTYHPRDDDPTSARGETLPPEATLVQIKAEDVLTKTSASLIRLFDMVLTKEAGNVTAKADIVVGGEVLAQDVPLTFLLFLERQLGEMHTMLKVVPTHDPSEQWHWDSSASAWATEVIKTARTKKVPRNHVRAAATDKHPAQVDVWTEDVVVGEWSTIKFTGAVPADRRELLIARVLELSDAVKFAREQANTIEVTTRQIGETMFDYILAG